jgi:hypothetical protein
MKILEKLKEIFAKGPKEPKQSKPKQDEPELHHHNHGSSTT